MPLFLLRVVTPVRHGVFACPSPEWTAALRCLILRNSPEADAAPQVNPSTTAHRLVAIPSITLTTHLRRPSGDIPLCITIPNLLSRAVPCSAGCGPFTMSSAKRASPCRLTSISPRGASIIYTGSPGHMVDEIACRTEPPVWDRPPTTCRVAIFSTVGGPDDGKPDDRTHTRPAARQQDCGRICASSPQPCW